MSTNSVEAEYKEIMLNNSWTVTYQDIGQQCQTFAYTCFEARKSKNRSFNRYRDVNPFDHSRIILTRGEVDYINANLVKIERAGRQYILTQGPLLHTVGHFWLMVWEQKSKGIIMLNKIVEKNEIKCHWYWPQAVGEHEKITLGPERLTIELLSEEDFSYYTVRVFKMMDNDTSETREILQYHYTTWPDFEVPSSPTAFLEFLHKVRSSGILEPNVGPAVVHCSAGIGRSGTFCLVDSCLLIIEKEGLNSVNVQEVLKKMRSYRMGLIQTSDQLRFSYLAIIEGARIYDPNWNEEVEHEMLENAYCMVAEEAQVAEEEAPPPPPPRAESLTKAPARPLPAIPTSTSLGNLNCAKTAELSSDEDAPTPPKRRSPVSNDDDDDEAAQASTDNAEPTDTLRRRRNREMSERVAVMKKRAREAERWHALKRLKSEENTETEPCGETEGEA